MTRTETALPEVVAPAQWRAARIELLAKEKEFTKARDALAAERRRLPMEEVTADYAFTGPAGEVRLPDLFEGRRQLLIYHFMFDPDWDEGCPSCSFLADNIGHLSHLHARDTTLALVSRAPYPKLAAYQERMGWVVPWYSSAGSDFNYDFRVTYDPAKGSTEYNYRDRADAPDWQGWTGESPGTSAFLREGDQVFHTYSSYARGGDLMIGTYNWLDLTALGRQEGWEQPPGRSDSPEIMGWLHRHDQY
ncbi:MAG TPA: DUF899 domain-containing protein [Mycobacteriales bacterium]|jgi:predicted dithiol-disulfide oxidoreductase (DUF899 family)|nr:DUF899 domain-containing protein [Mycobacteriales bacterium]